MFNFIDTNTTEQYDKKKLYDLKHKLFRKVLI